MKTHRTIFKHAMVRALLAGAKTQTRRHSTRARPGDRVLVLETWKPDDFDPDEPTRTIYRADWTAEQLRDTEPDARPKWKSPLFLRPDRCRIELEVTAVRPEKLQDITDADGEAEGALHWWREDGHRLYKKAGDPKNLTGRYAFAELWDHIHGQGKKRLESGFWVWKEPVQVITFSPVRIELP